MIEPMPLEDKAEASLSGHQPLLFEEVYAKEKMKYERGFETALLEKDLRRDGTHLIVLVHGFLGCAYDLRRLRNHLSLLHPDIAFLSASSNEFSESDIDE